MQAPLLFTVYQFGNILYSMRAQRMVPHLLLVIILLAGCGLLDNSDETGESELATPEQATPVAIVDPQLTPLFEPLPTATPQALELIVWIPPMIAARTEGGAQVLANQLQVFDDKYLDVSVTMQQKQARGDGGILNYLRTGRGVAPAILPDVVVLPAELLATAGNENLIFPLDDEVYSSDLEALYPSAQQLARPGDTVLGYPFALSGLPHLVYNSNVLTSTLPLTWARLISDPERKLIMPAGGNDGAVLAMQFYLDAGGQVENEVGQPILELEPLKVALNALQEGTVNNFIVPLSSNVSTEEQAWQIFLGGGASIVRTTSDHFLSQNTAGLPIEFTVTPGIDRPLTPLTSGWAWAISTSDPAREVLANELILDLVAAQNLSAWSQESDILPSRRDALAAWSGDGAYSGFIQPELDRADPMPVSSNSRLLTVLGDAAFQVVSGAKTADEAAEDALAALQS